MVKTTPKHTMPTVFRVLFSVIFMAIMATIFTWFILWRQNICDAAVTWDFIKTKPQIFWYSVVLVFLMMSVVVAALWRPFFGTGLCFAIFSVITYIHMQKFQFRSAPLLPEDFKLADQAGNIIQFVDPWSIVRLVAGVIFILIGSALLEHYARKVLGRERTDMPWWERWALVPRVSFTLIALTALTMASSFLIHHDMGGYTEYLGIRFEDWDPVATYKTNGFVLGFLYNLGVSDTAEPEGYSEERVRQIAQRYQAIKEAEGKTKKPLSQVVDNVIVVLDESFYDPEIFTEYYPHTGGDVVPELHKIFQQHASGYMYSPQYGGGTANVEFEVLTGLTNYWLTGIPYSDLIPKVNTLSSVASWAKADGFETTAVHAFDGAMYKRDLVYKRIGYTTFIDESKMTYTEQENGKGYISDQSTYREVLDVLKDGEKKHLVGVVTMQNHAPFNAAGYDDLHFRMKQTTLAPEQMENSYESLHKADEYLGEFIRELDKLDEHTVVLWFGDHAAAVLVEMSRSSDGTVRDLTRLMPYFIYTNFDIESEVVDAKIATAANKKLGFNLPTKGVDLEITSPNCLLNTMYNILNVEKPLLMYLLDDVCKETPVLARDYSGSSDIQEKAQVLQDYRMVTYDLLNGKQYWLKYAGER